MEIQRMKLFKDNKGTRPSAIMVSAIVIAMVIAGLFLSINDMTEDYGVNVTNNYSRTVTYISNTNDFNDTAGEVGDQAAKEANEGQEYTPLLKSMWKFASYAKNSFQQIRVFINNVAEVLDLPRWFVYPLGTILLIGVIAAIIGAIHKYVV